MKEALFRFKTYLCNKYDYDEENSEIEEDYFDDNYIITINNYDKPKFENDRAEIEKDLEIFLGILGMDFEIKINQYEDNLGECMVINIWEAYDNFGTGV